MFPLLLSFHFLWPKIFSIAGRRVFASYIYEGVYYQLFIMSVLENGPKILWLSSRSIICEKSISPALEYGLWGCLMARIWQKWGWSNVWAQALRNWQLSLYVSCAHSWKPACVRKPVTHGEVHMERPQWASQHQLDSHKSEPLGSVSCSPIQMAYVEEIMSLLYRTLPKLLVYGQINGCCCCQPLNFVLFCFFGSGP